MPEYDRLKLADKIDICMDERESLQSPQKFCFPFEPYDIQIKFMKALYEAIEERKIAIFESPTGNGNS